MPRATNAVTNDNTFSERAVVMRAMRVDCEHDCIALHKQYFFVTDVPDQPSFGKIRQRYPLSQIGSAWSSVLVGHGYTCSSLSHHKTVGSEAASTNR